MFPLKDKQNPKNRFTRFIQPISFSTEVPSNFLLITKCNYSYQYTTYDANSCPT